MSTNIRPEVSKKSEYWIDKHRYYELKHFCMQYPLWKKALRYLDGYSGKSKVIEITDVTNDTKPVEQFVEQREFYEDRIKLLKTVANETDPVIGPYILRGVAYELSYEVMNAHKPIPCSKDIYYKLYRKFFWILSGYRK